MVFYGKLGWNKYAYIYIIAFYGKPILLFYIHVIVFHGNILLQWILALLYNCIFKAKPVLELGVPRNTCVTCPGSFRKLTKGNNSKTIDARIMDPVHDTSSHQGLSIYEVSFQ